MEHQRLIGIDRRRHDRILFHAYSRNLIGRLIDKAGRFDRLGDLRAGAVLVLYSQVRRAFRKHVRAGLQYQDRPDELDEHAGPRRRYQRFGRRSQRLDLGVSQTDGGCLQEVGVRIAPANRQAGELCLADVREVHQLQPVPLLAAWRSQIPKPIHCRDTVRVQPVRMTSSLRTISPPSVYSVSERLLSNITRFVSA